MDHLLIYPMAFYVFHISCILLFSGFSRIRAVKSREVSIKAFRSYNLELPDHLIIRGRHFDNQFQVPILFMITCLVFMTLNLVNDWVVSLAWLFVVTRLFHSWVHLGKNNITVRLIIYTSSWVVLWGMWAILLFLVE